jgi:hypothetical protein
LDIFYYAHRYQCEEGPLYLKGTRKYTVCISFKNHTQEETVVVPQTSHKRRGPTVRTYLKRKRKYWLQEAQPRGNYDDLHRHIMRRRKKNMSLNPTGFSD